VALLIKSDTHHAWAHENIAHVAKPMLTCESVLSETCFLLARSGLSTRGVFELTARGALEIGFTLSAEIGAITHLMARYADAGISLADACLVRMSELTPRCQVMTIDRDFLVYRRDRRRAIPLLAPF
jgi:predicted nucleic acid-binding protein